MEPEKSKLGSNEVEQVGARGQVTKIISPSGLGAKRGKRTPRGEGREQRGEREREDEKETFCTVQRPSTDEEDAAAAAVAASQDN